MSLKITTAEMENRQLAITIEVPQDRVDEQLRRAARKLAGQYRIPGFRKGKAPYNIIVQYVGMEALYGEFMDDLGQEVYREAIEQEDLKPYAIAGLEDVSLDPMTYKLVMPLEPIVNLGDYRSLRVEEAEAVVDEERVTERLEMYREENSSWETAERPSEYGDVITIDVKSVIAPEEEGGEETIVLDETDWEVTLDEENPMEPAGFDGALIGMAAGETKEFDLSWPAEGQSIYAGKTAHYVVTAHGLDAFQKPELDDDFAQLVGPDYETLDDLLEDIRDSLRDEAEAEAENVYTEQAFNAALEMAELDYPPVVIEDQIDAMVNDYEQQLKQYGIESLASFFEQTGQKMDEYRESLRENAAKFAERNLILSELMQIEKITATEDELEAKIEEFIGGAGGDVEEADEETMSGLADIFRSGSGRSMLESQIVQEKTVERLLAIVRGEEIPEPVEEIEEEIEEEVEEEVVEEVAEEIEAEAEVAAEEESDSDGDAEAETDSE